MNRLTFVLLPISLAAVALMGAPCPKDPVECESDSDCDDNEECDDGGCVDASEGEGEGEGEGTISPAAIAAYCNHISECVQGQGGEFTPEECTDSLNTQLDEIAGDATCNAYRGAMPAVVTCYTAATCDEIFAEQGACVTQTDALNEAGSTCESLNTGSGGSGTGAVCEGFIGADDGCDCGCGEHDPDCDAVGGGCDVSGCSTCPVPADATGCEFCN